VIVRLRLRNLSARPNGLTQATYALVDTTGRSYPWYPWQKALRGAAAELYGSPPFSAGIPAFRGEDRVLIALVPNGNRRLELLGPGITLIRLS
jgi:hypothetical protein